MKMVVIQLGHFLKISLTCCLATGHGQEIVWHVIRRKIVFREIVLVLEGLVDLKKKFLTDLFYLFPLTSSRYAMLS